MFAQLLRTYQRTAWPRLLLDERLAGPFQEDAKHWLIGQGLPLLAQRPACSRVTIIRAADVYARLSAGPGQAASQHLRLPGRDFNSAEEARAWLNQG